MVPFRIRARALRRFVHFSTAASGATWNRSTTALLGHLSLLLAFCTPLVLPSLGRCQIDATTNSEATSALQSAIAAMMPSGASAFPVYGTFVGTVSSGSATQTGTDPGPVTLTWQYSCSGHKYCRLLLTHTANGQSVATLYSNDLLQHLINKKIVGRGRPSAFVPILPDPGALLLRDLADTATLSLRPSNLVLQSEQTIDLHVEERLTARGTTHSHDWYIGATSHLPLRLVFQQDLIRTNGTRGAEPDVTETISVDYRDFMLSSGALIPAQFTLTTAGTPLTIKMTSMDKSTAVTTSQLQLQGGNND
jgi:hypothetical protein